MSEENLAVEIRDAFNSTHVLSPGLEERVTSAIPWNHPRERSTFAPRLAGAFAATLAVVAIGILVAPALLGKLNLQLPGSAGAGNAPAYSLAAVSGDSVYVVQRGVGNPAPGHPAPNVLLQSKDGGHTWASLLQFAGIYGGMQVFGSDGFIWTVDMESHACSSGTNRCTPASFALALYHSANGGATWAALPSPSFPVNDLFFLDASRGWAASSSPETGLGGEVLYETADGGRTWARVGSLPPAPMSQVFGVGNYRVTFSRGSDGSLRGWCVGATELFTSVDAGRSWHPLTLSAPASVAAWITTPSQPAFSGQEGVLPVAYRDPKGPDNATANYIYLYVSHDGGSTWTDPRPAPAGFAPVGDILSTSILDSKHIWLTSLSLTAGDNVQASPAVARTSDGGLTWTVTHKTPRLLQMTFKDPSHGYALDVTGTYNVNGILKTSDGGATWQRVDVPIFSAG